jgi:two-component system sensor histidine kinase TctE
MKAGAGHDAPPSLRRVLLIWLLLPLLVLVPLTSALIYGLALRPALDGLDRALTDTAVALAQIVDVRDGQVTLPLSEQTARALRADLFDETYFAVSDTAGRLLGGSPDLMRLAPPLGDGQWRFFDAVLDGAPVRVAAHALRCADVASTRCTILVAETLGKRSDAQRSVLLAALAGAIALALPMVMLAMVAVNRGMQPLRAAAAEVASRTPGRLEPIETRRVPGEVAPFVNALNGLFKRLRESDAAQRAFVANAAHQLRTPLAVLKVEAAQALEAPHPAALRPSLERLHAAAERGARLAQQLLALARVEGAALDPARRVERLDLSQLARQAADQWLRPSLDAQQDLGFDLAPAWVDGDPLLLGELLGNLVHNAIEHAGPGSRVTLRTHAVAGCGEVCVEDDGPGIAPEERDSVWLRFHRGRGAAGTGSGLGLAIVADIAHLHDAQATLATGEHGHGLRVCVRFPPVPQADRGTP